MEAGLALRGPRHCRVMNDLMAEEVSSGPQALKMHIAIYDLTKGFIFMTELTVVSIS